MSKITRTYGLKLFFFFLVVVFLSACSAISYDTYYSPVYNEGKKVRTAKQYHEHVFFATGPHDVLSLDIDGLNIDIHSENVKVRVITIGPAIFPVIPAIPLWFYGFDSEKLLTIVLKLSHDTETIKIDCQKVSMNLNGEKIFPVSATPVYSLTQGGKYVLTYDVSGMELDSFDIQINTIDVGQKARSIPTIKFIKAGGWVMDAAP